jgi:hypothetical protein
MVDELNELMVNSRGERITPAQFAVRTVAYGIVGCFTLACFYATVVLFFCM